MRGTELLSALKTLYKDTREEPADVFIFAILAEMKRVIAFYGEDNEPQDFMPAYVTIAGEYKALGHYLFAAEYYEKALAAALQCVDFILGDEEEADEFTAWCAEMLLIYRKMGKKDADERVLSAVETAFPSLLGAIKKRSDREPHLKTDPVEYTEAYIAILPELEAKIEAELVGVKRGMGFCFQYWHTKAEILKRDYGIDWDSPSVLNPRVRFD